MADIIYKWGSGPASVGIAHGLSLPQFQILGHQQKQSVMSLSTGNIYRQSIQLSYKSMTQQFFCLLFCFLGNYSRLICEIRFARSLGFYLIQIYIPASLIVVISWVSFWLHRNATPARVALGVTTVLTMTTLMSSTNSQLPKVSYIKSIDVYLGTCFVMVFASLVEYATVGYLGKRITMRKARLEQFYKMTEEQKKKAVKSTPVCLPTSYHQSLHSSDLLQSARNLHATNQSDYPQMYCKNVCLKSQPSNLHYQLPTSTANVNLTKLSLSSLPANFQRSAIYKQKVSKTKKLNN